MKKKFLIFFILVLAIIAQPKTLKGQTTSPSGGATTTTTTGGDKPTTTTTTSGDTTTGKTSGVTITTSNGGTGTETTSDYSWIKDVMGGLISFFPIILHLFLLRWVKNSGMSLKDALSDKETLRQENAAQLRSQLESERIIMGKAPLMIGANLQDANNQKSLIDLERDIRIKFLENQNEIRNKNIDNQMYLLSNSATSNNTPPRIPSVSRLIVFIAGHAAIAIGVCLASFIMYFKLVVNTGADQLPSLNGFVGVLLALGIGVIPYAVNRITSSGNENTSQT